MSVRYVISSAKHANRKQQSTMASIFKKRNGWYYVQFCNNQRTPRQKQLALHTKRLRKAQAIRLQMEESYEAKEFDPWVDAAPEPVQTQHLLAHSIEAFMQTRSNLSLLSITKCCPVLGQFQRFLGADYCVSDIKPSDVSSLKPRILPGSPFIPPLSRDKLEPRDR